MEGGRRRNNTINNNNNNCYMRERCLTMHQPWASLLVHGIKRIEGRSWPSPITGRLWIHAAGKVPDDATIETMEEFYREIYARDGISDFEFPPNYPTSKLIGCVDVVGCVRREELARWKEVPEGVRLEALTDFCWLCEHPQKLTVPLQMGGWRGVYDLDGKISEAVAIGHLVQAETPFPINFPLPNPEDPFSLRPGSISPCLLGTEIEKSPKLRTVIDAASRAATQFLNKGQSSNNQGFDTRNRATFTRPEDARFVRKDHHIQNHRLNNRNQGDFNKPTATEDTKKEHNMGSNGFNNRNKREVCTSASLQFVPKHRIDAISRNERDFTRPAATRYKEKEHDMGSNGFDSTNKGELHTPASMHFKQKDRVDETSSLSSNMSRQYQINDSDFSESEENCNGQRCTHKIFVSAMRGISSAPRATEQ